MVLQLYKPFENLTFSKQFCFLSGKKLQSPEEEITVFPPWLMQEYDLRDKPFKLLDESMSTYSDMKLPCSGEIYELAIEPLEKEIQTAFLSGYDAVKQIPELRLFQWIAKMVYGILFNEIRIGMMQQKARNEEFVLSQSLIHKFSNLHLMLQSLNQPVIFEGNNPWSIRVFKLESSKDLFNYRDEINTLTFSLGMKDFGIIACLQDNGTNAVYHKDILSKLNGKAVHPAQLEEIFARFFYSNYLFNRLPEYTVMPTEDAVYIEAMPLRGMSNKPLFDFWQNKTYAQVLENFWKPWGILLFEILKDPENPLSYLLTKNLEIISAKSVDLPS
ncbi:MAG: hypothetical protein Q8S11_01610 [Daejeonella sp.]|uniref:hypothetical protein n=1 Tax=Daejeonella sp. TaxID=2805397 RepID=UPI0027358B86|nr:hypothetical protein [Daejeonella sp.]MDP3466998.1 hypothetical protein [Daejeonella sp.]